MAAGWAVAGAENIDWADRAGGQGSAYAGFGWLVAAVVAATASIVWTMRRGRQPA